MKTVENAVMRLYSEVNGLKVIGYWKKENGYVFYAPKKNTDYPYGNSYFYVKNNGSVEVTNPLVAEVEAEEMITY